MSMTQQVDQKTSRPDRAAQHCFLLMACASAGISYDWWALGRQQLCQKTQLAAAAVHQKEQQQQRLIALQCHAGRRGGIVSLNSSQAGQRQQRQRARLPSICISCQPSRCPATWCR